MKSLKEIYNSTFINGIIDVSKHSNIEYNDYINNHCYNVRKCFEEKFVPYCGLEENEIQNLWEQLRHHDESKWSDEEYIAYCDRFYPDGTKTEQEIHDAFAYAWLHHLHNNPHHPQYWYLRNDTDHDEDRPLDMPFNYIVEMLCDWGSFYYMNTKKKPGINPNSRAHDWWNLHKEDFLSSLSENTIKIVEEILDKCPDI